MREGYSNSILGEIPIEWEVEKFGSIFKYIKTYSFSRADLTFKNAHDNILYIHYGDIHATFERIDLDVKNESRVPVLIEPTNISDSDYLINGDLVIADASEDYEGVAKCIEIRGITDEKVIGGIHTIVARDEAGLTIEGFRCYLLLNKNVVKNIKRISTGTSVYGISKSNLSKLNVLLPPLPEQQKIATILTTVDDKIENIEAQISEYTQLKKGLMQQLLTKGIGHTEFKDSMLGTIPKDWEVVNINSITKDHKQGYYTKENYYSEGVKLVRITDLKNPKVDFSDMPFLRISDKDYRDFKIELNDFLFARSGAIGRYGIVESLEHPAIFGSYIIRFNFNESVLNRFVGYFYESNLCRGQLKSISQGNANVNINAENIKSLKLPKPSLPEQRKIVHILYSVDNKLEILQNQKQEFTLIKKGLMEHLLTGKVRVKV